MTSPAEKKTQVMERYLVKKEGEGKTDIDQEEQENEAVEEEEFEMKGENGKITKAGKEPNLKYYDEEPCFLKVPLDNKVLYKNSTSLE